MSKENFLNSAFISHGAIFLDDELEGARMKAIYILYDKVIFSGSKFIGQSFIEDIMSKENTSPSTKSEIIKMIYASNDLAPNFDISGKDEASSKLPWSYAPKILREVTSEVLSDFYGCDVSSDGTGHSCDAYKHGVYTMSDVLYWNKYFSNAVFVGDIHVESILRRVSESSSSGSLNSKWSEATTDIFTKISWDDVFELRRSPYLNAFRAAFGNLSHTGKAEKIINHYHAALEDLAGMFEPNVKRETIIGVLGNIPGLPINPVAVAASIASVHKANEVRNEYGWVFFIRKARQLESDQLK